MSRTVELHPAFTWTCDDCGRNNFVGSVVLAPETIDPDDMPETVNLAADEIRDWIEAGGEGGFCTFPDTVTCEHCGSEFEAEAP